MGCGLSSARRVCTSRHVMVTCGGGGGGGGQSVCDARRGREQKEGGRMAGSGQRVDGMRWDEGR